MVLPSLSDFILLIRDPLVIWIYYLGFAQGLFPTENKYSKSFPVVSTAVVATLLFNGGHPLSIAYGIHSNLLHFPLIFIIAKYYRTLSFSGKLSIVCPPHDLAHDTTVSCRTRRHHEYRGRGNATVETSGGKVRASGTFTFVSGPVFYFCFTMAFLIYGFLKNKPFQMDLYLGTSATFLAMVIVSRALIAELFKLLHVLVS